MSTAELLLHVAQGLDVLGAFVTGPLVWQQYRWRRQARENLDAAKQLQRRMLDPRLTPTWHETFTAMAADVEFKSEQVTTYGRELADAVRTDFPDWPDRLLAVILARVLAMAQAAERQADDRSQAFVMLTDLIEAAAVDLSAVDREFGS